LVRATKESAISIQRLEHILHLRKLAMVITEGTKFKWSYALRSPDWCFWGCQVINNSESIFSMEKYSIEIIRRVNAALGSQLQPKRFGMY